jgi:hypothetical protein
MALTAKELAMALFPKLPSGLSQCRSSSRTQPVTPRTFSDVRLWPNFLVDAKQFSATLDGQTKQYAVPMECFGPLNPCTDEVSVVYRDEMTVTWLCDGS